MTGTLLVVEGVGWDFMTTLFRIPDEAPLVGAVSFGLIDRGTNVIQVRPSTSCPLSCIFCSTDAGPNCRRRISEYEVGLEHLVEWFKELARLKGCDVEAHIDTVGDPFMYPNLVELVARLSDVKAVSTISMQTHGFLMNEKVVEELAEAGLDRINLSIDAMDPLLAKRLCGTEGYSVEKVIANAIYAIDNTSIDILLAPVLVRPLNDSEMEPLINLAKKIGAGKRWPALGIQKCEFHRFGRRSKEIKRDNWYGFYKCMRALEQKTGMKLVLRPTDFGIKSAASVAAPFRVGEKVGVRIIGPGWFKGESLGVTKDNAWAVTVVGEELEWEQDVRIRLLRTKDNIIMGRPS